MKKWRPVCVWNLVICVDHGSPTPPQTDFKFHLCEISHACHAYAFVFLWADVYTMYAAPIGQTKVMWFYFQTGRVTIDQWGAAYSRCSYTRDTNFFAEIDLSDFNIENVKFYIFRRRKGTVSNFRNKIIDRKINRKIKFSKNVIMTP